MCFGRHLLSHKVLALEITRLRPCKVKNINGRCPFSVCISLYIIFDFLQYCLPYYLYCFGILLFSISKGIQFAVLKVIQLQVPGRLKQVKSSVCHFLQLLTTLILHEESNFILYSLAIGTKLSEDSRKYGVENTCTSGSTLSKAAINFSRARAQMEKEHGILLKALGTQVLHFLSYLKFIIPLTIYS